MTHLFQIHLVDGTKPTPREHSNISQLQLEECHKCINNRVKVAMLTEGLKDFKA